MVDYADPTDPDVQAIVLTPTRELCIQVTQALRAYGEGRGIDVVAVFGGAPIRDQASRLKSGAQIVVGTVGRVLDMINRHHLYLDSARYVVLDEADEMLDLGFLEDVETILRRCPAGRQTALFSATVPPEIRRLADTFMHDPTEIKVRAATLTIDTVEQFYVEVTDREKPEALVKVLKTERPEQAIVFARTKIGVDRLARRLGDAGVRVKALHGDMSQGQRDGVMIAFKSGRERLLVATDVAARGLDITGVSHVVNYDIPNSPDIYVHRIGRTGRAGETRPRDHADHAQAAPTSSRRSSATPRPRSRSGQRQRERRRRADGRAPAAAEAGEAARPRRAGRESRPEARPTEAAVARARPADERDGDRRARAAASGDPEREDRGAARRRVRAASARRGARATPSRARARASLLEADRRRRQRDGIEPADIVSGGRGQHEARERRRAQRARARALQLRRGARRARGAGRGGGFRQSESGASSSGWR